MVSHSGRLTATAPGTPFRPVYLRRSGGRRRGSRRAGPGETITLDYAVTVPAEARPGAEWWALAKVMYFGRARYTESAQIRVTG